MVRTRRDVASLGAGWSDELVYYAKAVRRLQALAPADRKSWVYLGAIHGYDYQLYLARGVIQPADPLPPSSETNGRMWNQCQHQGWYFLPWHRGYLAAFEAIVGQAVEAEGGPDDWALPYWNYLNDEDPTARDIPQAFLDPELPDGSPNPLAATPRGPATTLGPLPWMPTDIDLEAMEVRRYTSPPGGVGFGGGRTGFNQFGGKTGAMESNPHNNVHVMVGGPPGGGGFLRDPRLAALDPIFWLHHCNVDRLWAAWLEQPGNIQEAGTEWRNGPFPRRFEMPETNGSLAVFTPEETLPGGRLAPTYDDLTKGTGSGGLPASVDSEEDQAMPATFSSEPPPPATLVGANSETLSVHAEPVATRVELAQEEADIAADPGEQRVYLNLENVRGTASSGVLTVRLGLTGAGDEAADGPTYAKSVALFGLARASEANDEHGGSGIDIAIDITNFARRLAQHTGEALQGLDVRLEQPPEANTRDPITVGRISVYKQPTE